MCECSSGKVRAENACAHCGGEIWTKPNKDGTFRKNVKRYCSEQCKEQSRKHTRKRRSYSSRTDVSKWPEAKRLKYTYQCKQCGVEFVNVQARSDIGIYFCSKACKSNSQRSEDFIERSRVFVTRARKACKACGSMFWTKSARFCSAICANNYSRRMRWIVEPRSLHHCMECGSAYVPLSRKRKNYCTKQCAARYERRASGKTHRHRANRYGVEYEPVNKLKVCERDGWKCQICGKKTPRDRIGTRYSNAPELDHRIPMSLGGPHTYDNTQCACRKCNIAKSNSSYVGQMPLFSIAYRGE